MMTRVLASAFLAAPAPWAQEREISVGARRQSFIDHKFIESAEGVSLVMNAPQRTGEVLLQADAPWEKSLRIGSYSTVALEGGRVRLWYQVSGRENPPGKNPDFMGVAYAESADGIHFRKPILGLVEFEGSRQNNLVLPADPRLLSIGGGSVWRDDNPACPPQERYKSWQKVYPKPGSGIFGPPPRLGFPGRPALATPGEAGGGIARRRHPARMVPGSAPRPLRALQPGVGAVRGRGEDPHGELKRVRRHARLAGDVHLAPAGRVGLRGRAPAATGCGPHESAGRGVGAGGAKKPTAGDQEVAAGQDQAPMPGAPVDIYGPEVFPYTEADGVYVALLSAFHHWERRDGGSRPDTADVRLGVSRDARHFVYPGARQPFLRLGPAGSFDAKWIWAMPRPVRMGDELWVYYFGANGAHGSHLEAAAKAKAYGISSAVMRLDGFVSADFDCSGGALITTPLRFEGSRLELNLDTSAGGAGRVEILDAEGRPLRGFSLLESDTLNGNSVRMAVTWRGRGDVRRWRAARCACV